MSVLLGLLAGLAAWAVARVVSGERAVPRVRGDGSGARRTVDRRLPPIGRPLPLAEWWTRVRARREAQSEAPDLLELAACLAASGLMARDALRQAAVGRGPLSAAIIAANEADALGGRFLESLEEACERLGVVEGRSLARALRSAETLGTSLAGALRGEAARSRERQRLRVMRAADGLPFKLALVTTLFFLPSLVVLLLVPNLLNFLERW